MRHDVRPADTSVRNQFGRASPSSSSDTTGCAISRLIPARSARHGLQPPKGHGVQLTWTNCSARPLSTSSHRTRRPASTIGGRAGRPSVSTSMQGETVRNPGRTWILFRHITEEEVEPSVRLLGIRAQIDSHHTPATGVVQKRPTDSINRMLPRGSPARAPRQLTNRDRPKHLNRRHPYLPCQTGRLKASSGPAEVSPDSEKRQFVDCLKYLIDRSICLIEASVSHTRNDSPKEPVTNEKMQDRYPESRPITCDFQLGVHDIREPALLEHAVGDHILELSDRAEGWVQLAAVEPESESRHRYSFESRTPLGRFSFAKMTGTNLAVKCGTPLPGRVSRLEWTSPSPWTMRECRASSGNAGERRATIRRRTARRKLDRRVTILRRSYGFRAVESSTGNRVRASVFRAIAAGRLRSSARRERDCRRFRPAPPGRAVRRGARLPADEAPGRCRAAAGRIGDPARGRAEARQAAPGRALRGGAGRAPKHRRAAARAAAGDPPRRTLRHDAAARLPGREQQRGRRRRGDRDREGALRRHAAQEPARRPVPAHRRRGGARRASRTSTPRACAEARRTPPPTRGRSARRSCSTSSR